MLEYRLPVHLALNSPNDYLALPAFVISIIAAASGLGALGWNVWAWRQSGARVTLEVFAAHSADVQWITVIVRNLGRSAITVNEVVLFEDGNPASPESTQTLLGTEEGDERVPHRLEPQSSLEFEEQYKHPDPMHGHDRYWVSLRLANGDEVNSRWVRNM